MAETRSYMLGTTTIEELGNSVATFLRGQDSMEVEGHAGPGGYLVQARARGGEWRKFVGLERAIQVRILPVGPGSISVSVGQGKWIDKLGVGAVGAIWFPPLLVAAGFGAFTQLKLEKDVLAHIESFLIVGGGQ